MTSRRIGLGALFIAAIAALVSVTGVLQVNAQSTGSSPTDQLRDAVAKKAGPLNDAAATLNEKEVTLTGRVVDFHCFMTGEMPSADAAKCTADCIRAGVPAGLETSQGLIVLGQGVKGPVKALLPFAHQTVEVRGTLFERDGVKYLDIASVEKSAEPVEEE